MDSGAQRLLKHVLVDMDTGCWVAQNSLTTTGYARVKLAGGKYVRAARLVYTLTHGPIPDGLVVCHACDYPPCVNPNHLWVGTRKDNSADAVRKGRLGQGRTGQGQRSRLTDAQWERLLGRYEAGESQKALAKEHGVSPSIIRKRLVRAGTLRPYEYA